MAALILAAFPLGMILTFTAEGPSSPLLLGLHVTLGTALIALVPLSALWHLSSGPSAPKGPQNLWLRLEKVWIGLLYVLMIAVPISGWAGSSASRTDMIFAGTITIPPLVGPGETSAFVWFILHEIFAKTLVGMLILTLFVAFRRRLTGDGALAQG